MRWPWASLTPDGARLRGISFHDHATPLPEWTGCIEFCALGSLRARADRFFRARHLLETSYPADRMRTR